MHETEVDERVADAAAEGGEEKRAYVRTVFEQIAPRYDLLNHLLSLNIDRAVAAARAAGARLARPPGRPVSRPLRGNARRGRGVDAGSRAFAGFIVGADFAVPMLRGGRGQGAAQRCSRRSRPTRSSCRSADGVDAGRDGGVRHSQRRVAGPRARARCAACSRRRAVRDPRVHDAALGDRARGLPLLLPSSCCRSSAA